LLNNNTSSTCPYNTVNFGPLVADISSVVWGTLANFDGFHVLAVLLHNTLVVGRQPNFASLNRVRHLQGGHHVGHWPHSSLLLYG